MTDFTAPFVSAADPAATARLRGPGLRLPAAGWAQAACSGATAACGWYTDSLVSTLRLEEPTLVVEERGIIATASVLTEIRVPLVMPGASATGLLLPRLIYGGELVDCTTAEQGDEQSVGVRLPAPLTCGSGHQFGLAVIRTVGGTFADRHLYSCLNRCDLFVARVRFANGWRPTWVRRVDGLRTEDLDEPPSRGDLLPVDSVGEATARFRDLQPGRHYGLSWGRQWMPDGLYRLATGRHRGAPGGESLRDRRPLP